LTDNLHRRVARRRRRRRPNRNAGAHALHGELCGRRGWRAVGSASHCIHDSAHARL